MHVYLCRGLNLDVVILNILNVYHDPGNLVLVLNCSEGEEAYYRLRLGANNVYSSLHSKANEREDQYLSGGIHFTSANVLVVDMLRNRIPVDKITGIVVFRAHSIVESCQEAFVLRLYRQRNKVIDNTPIFKLKCFTSVVFVVDWIYQRVFEQRPELYLRIQPSRARHENPIRQTPIHLASISLTRQIKFKTARGNNHRFLCSLLHNEKF